MNTQSGAQTQIFTEESVEAESKGVFPIGVTETGSVIIEDLTDSFNLLVFGDSGTGKTSFVYSILNSLLVKNAPSELRLAIYDGKRVDYGFFNNDPHMLIPVVNDQAKAMAMLGWVGSEINNRIEKFSKAGVRNLESYNSTVSSDQAYPRILVVLDDINSILINTTASDCVSFVLSKCNIVGVHIIATASSLTPKEFKNNIVGSFAYRAVFRCAKTDAAYLTGSKNIDINSPSVLLLPLLNSTEVKSSVGILSTRCLMEG